MKNTIEKTIELHQDRINYFKSSCTKQLEEAASMIIKSLKAGGTVYLCGNGGSAADCQHIAGEIVGRFRKERKAYSAVALTCDSSVTTSIANDYGYDEIFRRQVEGLGREGDVLWAFSTSGTSTSIIKAAEQADGIGMKILSFTGKPDSLLEEHSDVCICANCDVTSISQEVHMLAYHIICDLVEQGLSD